MIIPTLLQRSRAIDLFYVRDVGPADHAALDDADEVEVLVCDCPSLVVTVGRIGEVHLATVRVNTDGILAEFGHRPSRDEVLAARDLHVERRALGRPLPGSARRA